MRSLVTAVIALILILPAAAQAEGVVFRYVTDDGVVSFTDDVDMIPQKYEDAAEKLILGKFKDRDLGFKRLVQVSVTPEVETPEERLNRLREINTTLPRVVGSETEFTAPFSLTREMRWLDNVLGAPGYRYVSVDVLYDATDRVIAWALSDIGLGSAVYVSGQLPR